MKCSDQEHREYIRVVEAGAKEEKLLGLLLMTVGIARKNEKEEDHIKGGVMIEDQVVKLITKECHNHILWININQHLCLQTTTMTIIVTLSGNLPPPSMVVVVKTGTNDIEVEVDIVIIIGIATTEDITDTIVVEVVLKRVIVDVIITIAVGDITNIALEPTTDLGASAVKIVAKYESDPIPLRVILRTRIL
jgi:hypothetical protein